MHFQQICTDVAPAMIGVRRGFVTLVKSKWPHISNSRCSLHRYAFASKTMPPDLMSVLDSVISSINLIKGRAKNHRLFELMAQEMGSTHTSLLYYTQVRWLSGESVWPGSLKCTRKWRSSFARWNPEEIIATKTTKTRSF